VVVFLVWFVFWLVGELGFVCGVFLWVVFGVFFFPPFRLFLLPDCAIAEGLAQRQMRSTFFTWCVISPFLSVVFLFSVRSPFSLLLLATFFTIFGALITGGDEIDSFFFMRVFFVHVFSRLFYPS